MPSSPIRRSPDIAALAIAGALSTSLMALLASTPRRWLLLDDGDSVLPLLLHRSLAAGEAQDWALSSVLFVPEMASFLALAATGLEPHAALLAAGVVNLIALYVALRWLAGAALPTLGPTARCLAAFAAFGCYLALAATERSADRNALELASLQCTTTYYAATVIELVIGTGLLIRWARVAVRSRPRRPLWPLVALGLLLALGGASNLLLYAWIVPCVAATTIVAGSWGAKCRALVGPWLVLGVAAAASWLIRIPCRGLVVDTIGAKVRPAAAGASWQYFGALLEERAGTPLGMLECALVALGLAAAGCLAVSGLRKRDVSGLLGASAVAMAAGAAAFTIGLGTTSARYLQPVVLAAALGALGSAGRLAARVGRGTCVSLHASAARSVCAMVCLAAAATATVAAGRLDLAAQPDPDARCVSTWAENQGGVGAGDFWAIRPVAAAAAHQAALVQTDSQLSRYAWLVNRAGLVHASASFVVTSAGVPVDLPRPADALVRCGRFTIHQFAPDSLSLGPIHS